MLKATATVLDGIRIGDSPAAPQHADTTHAGRTHAPDCTSDGRWGAGAALLSPASSLLLLLPGWSAAEVQAPALRSPVVDRADVLRPTRERALTKRLLDFEQQTGHQAVVHITPSLEGRSIEDYSLAVAKQWKVGRAGLDDGVVLTIAPNERKVRWRLRRGRSLGELVIRFRSPGVLTVTPAGVAHVDSTLVPERRHGVFERRATRSG